MARAARAMEQLGFALTPFTPQRHTLATGELAPTGTANRLAILQDGYIELLTAVGDTPLADQMRRAIARYAGAHLIAFGSGRCRGDPRAARRRRLRSAAARAPAARRRDARGRAPRPLLGGPRAAGPDARRPHAVLPAPYARAGLAAPASDAIPNGVHSLTDILLCVDDVGEAAARYGRFLGLPGADARGISAPRAGARPAPCLRSGEPGPLDRDRSSDDAVHRRLRADQRRSGGHAARCWPSAASRSARSAPAFS